MAHPIVIDDALTDKIEHLARIRQRSATSLLEEALAQFLAREEAREAFLREAEGSWSDYLATGRHLTGEEAMEWIGTWGTPDERPAPRCHE